MNYPNKGDEFAIWYKNIIENAGYEWKEPHITIQNGETVLEWWNEELKLTIYLELELYFLKSCGPDMFLDMEDGLLNDKSSMIDVWKWLNNL